MLFLVGCPETEQVPLGIQLQNANRDQTLACLPDNYANSVATFGASVDVSGTVHRLQFEFLDDSPRTAHCALLPRMSFKDERDRVWCTITLDTPLEGDGDEITLTYSSSAVTIRKEGARRTNSVQDHWTGVALVKTHLASQEGRGETFSFSATRAPENAGLTIPTPHRDVLTP